MTRKDGRFLPSLALALAVHALLLFLLWRALSNQVFEAPAAALEVQVASVAAAVESAADPAHAPPRGRAAAPAAAVVPPVPVPQAVPAAPAPETAPAAAAPPAVPQPTAPVTPSATPASSTDAATAVPPSTAVGNGSAPGDGAATASDGAQEGAGGGGTESADAGGGSGIGTYKADIDPALIDGSLQAPYPVVARRLGQQGTVRVLVEVGVDGSVVSEQVYVSSGHRVLDAAALEAVKKARFFPARKGGKAVPARIIQPVRFSLTD